MKKGLVIGLSVLGVVVLVCGIVTASEYNALVNADETVALQSAGILASLASRDSLVAQLVTTAGTYLNHESEVYQMITDARAEYADAVASGSYTDLINADAATSLALTSLLAVVEDTPELSGDQVIIDLMGAMETLEYTLHVSRTDYNNAVATYNASIRRFPRVLFAKMFGFAEPKPYWSKTDGEDITVVFPLNA